MPGRPDEEPIQEQSIIPLNPGDELRFITPEGERIYRVPKTAEGALGEPRVSFNVPIRLRRAVDDVLLKYAQAAINAPGGPEDLDEFFDKMRQSSRGTRLSLMDRISVGLHRNGLLYENEETESVSEKGQRFLEERAKIIWGPRMHPETAEAHARFLHERFVDHYVSSYPRQRGGQ